MARKRKKTKPTEEVPALPPDSPHGIYVYAQGSWKLLRSEGPPFQLGELGDGLYMIYFDNTRCEACRMQDPEWFRFVSSYSGPYKLHAVIVLCEWFAQNCKSPAAAETYRKFRIRASPTIIVALVENNKVKCMKMLFGVRFQRELEYHSYNPCK